MMPQEYQTIFTFENVPESFNFLQKVKRVITMVKKYSKMSSHFLSMKVSEFSLVKIYSKNVPVYHFLSKKVSQEFSLSEKVSKSFHW